MLSREKHINACPLGKGIVSNQQDPSPAGCGAFVQMVDRSGESLSRQCFEGVVQFNPFSSYFPPGDRLSPGKGANGVNCSLKPSDKSDYITLLFESHHGHPCYLQVQDQFLDMAYEAPSSPALVVQGFLQLYHHSQPVLFSTFLHVWKVHSPRQEHHLYSLWCAGSKTLPMSSGD